MKAVLPLFAAVALLGCGDARQDFVGTYGGASTWIITYPNGSTDSFPSGELTVVIDAPAREDYVTIGGGYGRCPPLTAKAKNDTALNIDPKTCETRREDVGVSTEIFCDLTDIIRGGTGTLTGDTLVLSTFGETLVERCSDGGPDETWTFTDSGSFARR